MRRFSLRFWILVLHELVLIPSACVIVPTFFWRMMPAKLCIAYLLISIGAAFIMVCTCFMPALRKDRLAFYSVLVSMLIYFSGLVTLLVQVFAMESIM